MKESKKSKKKKKNKNKKKKKTKNKTNMYRKYYQKIIDRRRLVMSSAVADVDARGDVSFPFRHEYFGG